MAKICTQFHALPEELVALVRGWVSEPGVHAYFLGKGSSDVLPLVSAEIEPVVTSTEVKNLIFTTGEANLGASTLYDFIGKNHGALVLTLGRVTGQGLEESALMAIAEEPMTQKTWNKFNRQLKAATTAGVVVQSLVKEGHFDFDRSHRYSAGAKALAQRGVASLGLGTGYIYRPDLPQQTPG